MWPRRRAPAADADGEASAAREARGVLGRLRALRRGVGTVPLADAARTADAPLLRHVVWMARVSMFTAASSAVIAVALLAWRVVEPARTVHVPLPIRVGSFHDRVIFFEPGQVPGDVMLEVKRGQLADYIEWRETIDGQSETYRYERMNAMTDAEEMMRFLNIMKIEGNKNSPLKRFFDAGMVREVRARFVSALGGDLYRVEYETCDRPKSPPAGRPAGLARGDCDGKRAEWVATVTMTQGRQAVRGDQVRANPFGLTVVAVDLTEKKL